MPKLREVCRYIRSKQAGPFWITFDIYFDGRENFNRYHESEALSAEAFAQLYGANPAFIKRIPVPQLDMIKISYPRLTPQGGIVERDMHAGQQYVRLLNVSVD
ncbi:DUF4387 domain-containing protein [Pseudomonas sp. KSR10]|jgi:hypothetical protein|uniref:DUF4387 domain-containing protein n=1 Tax=Pseudomonas sp. KSR10 TaxID=2916654 RepID=UPI001EF864AF|nr:DUF4387 domain-containing protein [Pseudomonas sp. KSR10]MCG6538552.1 DUF4387 domain-containing protein [Pseudomonas sp. KSR10]